MDPSIQFLVSVEASVAIESTSKALSAGRCHGKCLYEGGATNEVKLFVRTARDRA